MPLLPGKLGFYRGPALGVTFPDRILVAWLYSPDAQAATSDILVAVSTDRGMQWSAPQRLNRESTVDSGGAPVLAADASGQAVAAWQDFRLGPSTSIFATGFPAE